MTAQYLSIECLSDIDESNTVGYGSQYLNISKLGQKYGQWSLREYDRRNGRCVLYRTMLPILKVIANTVSSARVKVSIAWDVTTVPVSGASVCYQIKYNMMSMVVQPAVLTTLVYLWSPKFFSLLSVLHKISLGSFYEDLSLYSVF